MHSAPTPTTTTRRPWLTLLALAAGVALLHLALWHGMADSFAAGATAQRSPLALQFQIRTVEPLVPPELSVKQPVAVVTPTKPAPPRPRQATQPPAQPEPALPPAPVLTEEPVLVAAALPAQPAPDAAPASAPTGDDVPVYRTQIPPAMTLNYEMHRGALSGTGELQWRPTASGYQARLEGRMLGFSILTWFSEGGFDADGLAPVRFTDQRRSKAAVAANFQRQAGKISFSGTSTEYPLLQGSQDRLSWMIQIAAIAAASPQRVAPGGRVTMFVAGARGDADAWSFKVQGVEEVSTGESTVRAIKLLREPRKPYDTRVEVWLAPSLHYLPVRARLTNDDSTLELLLQTAQPAS